MPRVNPLRSLANERNVAERVRFEREKRGWTYAGLAERMTRDGNPIQASAVYKIEKADPPRRVTVDELVSFCRIFDLDASDMLRPMTRILDQEAVKIVQKIDRDMRSLWRTIDSLVSSHVSMWRLNASADQTDQNVLGRILRRLPSGSVNYPMGPDNHPESAHVSPDPISDAVAALFEAFNQYGRWSANYEEK